MATAQRPHAYLRITSATSRKDDIARWARHNLPAKRAGEVAFLRFCMPKLSRFRSPDHEALAERARFHLRNAEWVKLDTPEGRVQAYVFEPKETGGAKPKSVLIAHGWTSEASFMAVIAEQLRKAGLRVVAFDQPAHGMSERTSASLVDCSRALLSVAEQLGPFDSALAHSMGCLATLFVGEGGPPMPRAYPFERYVFISSPNKFGEVTQAFSDEIGLTYAGHREFERKLEHIAHRPVREFTAVNLLNATGKPALLIHDRDDEDVAAKAADEIAAACSQTEVLLTDGLGHRNILFAPQAIRAAVSYLK